ncbi:hypothetical protein [Acidipila sp. EB88]|uniref:hypothetical protein n=1 Tax=Acidipila sp. EB88 TaxID=2305226 RepID=UPI000F5D5659|nr:hypothetical protein [Acidipila sp. EB88]RRA48352.1 hypothetical protein D1Y84_08680 [Acidipila sp. EB88]
MKTWGASLVTSFVLFAGALSGSAQDAPSTLLFQTDHAWSPRTNIGADTVLVYGIDPTLAQRIRTWQAHGYRTAVMTGVAWGRYAPYLRGDFDGKEHWDETQQEKSGKLILHSGREVPYIAPSEAYGRYLSSGVLAALDAGAQAVYLEEPEFWADAGWSDSFKRSWAEHYHTAWQAPDSSPEAQYRASELKYFLYRRTLQQVFDAVRAYGKAHNRVIPCYVATHSLLNYAQWHIVSPESSLLGAGVDGFIAQVWTGTARAPNVYNGVAGERTFETAFLEYGALQNIARSSGKPIWYLNDPIEDNPNHSWTDYQQNWESTLTASLLQSAVARYEVLPWPNRIFDRTALYASAEPTSSQPAPPKTPIPPAYATELQAVFHALGDMGKYSDAHWEQAGTMGLGVLVSDTLMFQRAEPQPSDPDLSNFYGLAMPLLKRGMPVEPVAMEDTSVGAASTKALAPYRMLLLTYEGQKPPSAAFHASLAQWVRAGGVLLVVDNDHDPYNKVEGWWNTGALHYATPRAHLFELLGLAPDPVGAQHVGKGIVLYSPQSPTAMAYSGSGSDAVLTLVHTAAAAGKVALTASPALVLRRGPFVVAAGLSQDAGNKVAAAPLATSTIVHGDLVDLFRAGLDESGEATIAPGRRALFLDVSYFPAGLPAVLAASARITGEHATAHTLDFRADGIEDTDAVVRILATTLPSRILVDNKPLAPDQYSQGGRTLLLRFTNRAEPQAVRIEWPATPSPGK